MNLSFILLLLLLCIGAVYHLALYRGKRVALQNGPGSMHSRPQHHAVLIAVWCGVPALLIVLLWHFFAPHIITTLVLNSLPESVFPLSDNATHALMQRLDALASGYGVAGEVAPYEQEAAQHLKQFQQLAFLANITLATALMLISSVWAMRHITPSARARLQVETLLRWLLLACSAVAIFTTVGILLSMLGETLRFFSFIAPLDFFLGTEWNPVFSSTGNGTGKYGLLPLLSGTLMVSFIALCVAIPVGLMTAIYLVEYAPPWCRTFTKPIIEVLAGIPTIVYGVFALMVVGPFFTQFGSHLGLSIRATSALTAGVVMGIMIVPFMSSLSDDVISQVPQSLRDGSLGLGATRSETIIKVVLPAALPGIIGAFLLAASRAIGETMIVVLAAGNSPRLHSNPFEAVSTVTVSIVNQLTGDTDFAGPQSLVAFALGFTLFAITLVLNVVALYIVRKFSEQYE